MEKRRDHYFGKSINDDNRILTSVYLCMARRAVYWTGHSPRSRLRHISRRRWMYHSRCYFQGRCTKNKTIPSVSFGSCFLMDSNATSSRIMVVPSRPRVTNSLRSFPLMTFFHILANYGTKLEVQSPTWPVGLRGLDARTTANPWVRMSFYTRVSAACAVPRLYVREIL